MSARARLALDFSLLALLLSLAYPTLTGLPLHEWLGVVVILPALYHLVVNWEWVVRILTTVAEKIRAASVVNLVVDALLFVAVVAVTLSGFAVVPEIAAAFGGSISRTWLVVHRLSSDVTVFAMLVHLSLHWRWVYSVTRRMLEAPRPQRSRPVYARAEVRRTESRRTYR